MKEQELNSLCKESLFKKVYETYATSIQDFLTYKYGSQFNPQDTVQEIFIKLWNNCQKVSLEKVKSYLFTLANNHTLNEIKHQKVVLKYQKISPASVTNESPEFIMEEEQFLENYKKARENLSEDHRVAFLLNKAEGKKHQEIADMLGVTRKVVEHRIYGAFKQLKTELENFNLK
jgi:RNA polymerase sigma-70 factor (ECF subfamily)